MGIWSKFCLFLFLCFLGLNSVHAETPIDFDEYTFGAEPGALPLHSSKFTLNRFQKEKRKEILKNFAVAFANLTQAESIKFLVHPEYKQLTYRVRPKADSKSYWEFSAEMGGFEIRTPVMSFAETQAIDAFEPLFAAMPAANVAPEIHIGGDWGMGGHIHVGGNIFKNRPLLLRNFVAHYYSNPYIQLLFEEFADDQSILPRDEKEYELLRKAIGEVDLEFLKGKTPEMEWVAKVLSYAVRNGDRLVAINLTNLFENNGIVTAEIRGFRSPVNARMFRRRFLFVAHYLYWLSTLKEPIPFGPPSTTQHEWFASPTLARTRWNSFIENSLKLSPSLFDEEWESKFEPVAKKTKTTSAGEVFYEVRKARWASNTVTHEVLVESRKRPGEVWVTSGAFGGKKRLRFTEVAPSAAGTNRWLALLHTETLPDSINLKFKGALQKLSGKVDLIDEKFKIDINGKIFLTKDEKNCANAVEAGGLK